MTVYGASLKSATDLDGTLGCVGPASVSRSMLDGGRRRTPRAVARVVVMLLNAALMPACATVGSHEGAALKNGATVESTRSFAAPQGEWPNESWWKGYGDSQLNALIDEALGGSPTLAVAEARLRRANAGAQSTRGAMRPQVSANTSATEQKQSYNYLSPPNFTPQGWNDYGRASLDFSWELDFFGRNRAALAAATSEAEAARADVAQAQLTLSTSIASAYAELAREYAALDTAQAALNVRIKTAQLFEQRQANGMETVGSLRQVESRRASAEGDVLSLEEQIALQKNRIAALLGAGPDRGLAITRPAVDLKQDFALPGELAANLLGRRPDLISAKLRAEAAASRVKQARAAFYPNINLAAFIGVQSLGLERLTENGSSIGSAGPAISLPIFNGGRLHGQLHGVQAEYAEAVASYERTLVQALQDVADAAVSQKALSQELARSEAAETAARDAWQIQSNRYRGGLATYLEVLSAEDYLLSTERAHSDLASRSFALDVALKRALGGGYSHSL